MKLVTANKLNRLWKNGIIPALLKKIDTARVLTTVEQVTANTNEANLPSAVVVSEIYDNLRFPDGSGFYPDVQNGERGFNTSPTRGADTFVPFRKGLEDMPVYAKAMQVYTPPASSSAPQTYPLWNIDISKFKKCRVEFIAAPSGDFRVSVLSLLFNGKTVASGGNSVPYSYLGTIDLAAYKPKLTVDLSCTDATSRNNPMYGAVALIFS